MLVWPPPLHLTRAGSKDPDCASLDWICDQMDNCLRPKTTYLKSDFTTADIEDNTVLKRPHSDCGHHVIFPDERRKRNDVYMRQNSPSGERWLMQEYVPTLQTVGEWRTFIVNGCIIHTVHTFKNLSTGKWIAKQVNSFWTLQEMK